VKIRVAGVAKEDVLPVGRPGGLVAEPEASLTAPVGTGRVDAVDGVVALAGESEPPTVRRPRGIGPPLRRQPVRDAPRMAAHWIRDVDLEVTHDRQVLPSGETVGWWPQVIGVTRPPRRSTIEMVPVDDSSKTMRFPSGVQLGCPKARSVPSGAPQVDEPAEPRSSPQPASKSTPVAATVARGILAVTAQSRERAECQTP
jgi:hypothetical protein